MLTISDPIHLGQLDYYVRMVVAAYYLGADSAGKWIGRARADLNLPENIIPIHFQRLLAGYAPRDGVTPLVQNVGAKDRQAGIDLTFSAPKCVSVLWGLGPKELQQELEKAHWESVMDAWMKIEEELAFGRRGKGGHILEHVKLVAAGINDFVSRANEMQIHTHLLVMTTCVRHDGTTGAIWNSEFFYEKMGLGALYQKGMAQRIGDLGFEIEQANGTFTIRGIDQRIENAFSSRSQAIRSRMAEQGLTGAVAAKIAALDTREAKQEVPLGVLRVSWRKTAEALGWNDQILARIRHALVPEKAQEQKKAQESPHKIQPEPTTHSSGSTERDRANISTLSDSKEGPAGDKSHSQQSSEGRNKRDNSRAKKRKIQKRPSKQKRDRLGKARPTLKFTWVRPFGKAPAWNPFSRLTVPSVRIGSHLKGRLTDAHKSKLKELLKRENAVAITTNVRGRRADRLAASTAEHFADQGRRVIVVTGSIAASRSVRRQLKTLKAPRVSVMGRGTILRELDSARFSISRRRKLLFPRAPFPDVNPLAAVTKGYWKFNHSPLRLRSDSVIIISEGHKLRGNMLGRLRSHAEKVGAKIVVLRHPQEENYTQAWQERRRDNREFSRLRAQQQQSHEQEAHQSQNQSR